MTLAVVTAPGITETSGDRVVRALAPLYPPFVAAVVLLTANHYVVDTMGGSILGRLALRVTRRSGRGR